VGGHQISGPEPGGQRQLGMIPLDQTQAATRARPTRCAVCGLIDPKLPLPSTETAEIRSPAGRA
jgi:hypothetical protein